MVSKRQSCAHISWKLLFSRTSIQSICWFLKLIEMLCNSYNFKIKIFLCIGTWRCGSWNHQCYPNERTDLHHSMFSNLFHDVESVSLCIIFIDLRPEYEFVLLFSFLPVKAQLRLVKSMRLDFTMNAFQGPETKFQ